jgi:hypothetical protein
MKTGSSIAESLFSGTQSSKVLGSLGDDVRAKFKGDSTDIFSSDFHIKVDCNVERRKQTSVLLSVTTIRPNEM